MYSSRAPRRFVGALLACALCFSSTTAAAATVPAASSVNPWAALSALSSPASASAACAVGAAGAAAASAAQAAVPGCVLPVLDPPPPIQPAPVATPVFAPAPDGGGIGVLPILLGLAVVAGIAALLLLNDDDDDDEPEPISPN